MDRLSKLIVNLEIHNKILLLVDIENFKGIQTVYQGIFLKEYIPIKNYFIKGGIYIMLDRMVVLE